MSAFKHWVFRNISRACAPAGPARPRAGLRVLMYHSVGTSLPDDPYGIAIGAELFKTHMGFLASLRPSWELVAFRRPSGKGPQLAVTFDDGFKDTLTAAAPLLAGLNIPMTVFVTAGHVRGAGRLYLNPAELKELSRLPGVTIGAHGDTHARLVDLGDDALRRQLSNSRRYLEDLLGRPVQALSYPHGAVDRRVRDAAEEAGFTLGGCSRYGLNTPERDPLILCRTEVTAWDTEQDLALKTRGQWDWYRFRHPDPAENHGLLR